MGTLATMARRLLPHPVYRAIRTRRVGRQIRRFPSRLHTGSYGGHELTLRLRDALAEGWYGYDWPVLPEFAALKERGVLRPGARVFDLGAHQALLALMFSRAVGADGHVVAVEAEPHNVEVARENAALNKAKNLVVVHAAVTEADGSVPFAVGLNGRVDQTSLGNITVPAVTIDTLASQHGMPDIVFLDIEGYEGQALKGAEKVLASGAAFFVEVHTDRLVGATAEEIIRRLGEKELLIARDPGDGAAHSFEPFHGEVPIDRFYVLAL